VGIGYLKATRYFEIGSWRERRLFKQKRRFLREKFGAVRSPEMAAQWEETKRQFRPETPVTGVIATKCGTTVFVDAGLTFPVLFETSNLIIPVPANGRPVSGVVIACDDATRTVQIKTDKVPAVDVG
jgi:hypothetical protein